MWLVYSKSKEEVLWKNNVKLEKTHLKDQVRTAIVNKTPSLPFRRVSENCLIIWNYHMAANKTPAHQEELQEQTPAIFSEPSL